MHFVFLGISLNFMAETPFKSHYVFTPTNPEPAGLSEKLWTTLSTEFHGVVFSNTIIPKHLILISKFLFPYSIFAKYTTWLNYIFILLTYIHLLISFLTTLSSVPWHDIVSVIVTSDECRMKRPAHRQNLVVHTKVTTLISFLFR
jgi:hypothetical protein